MPVVSQWNSSKEAMRLVSRGYESFEADTKHDGTIVKLEIEPMVVCEACEGSRPWICSSSKCGAASTVLREDKRGMSHVRMVCGTCGKFHLDAWTCPKCRVLNSTRGDVFRGNSIVRTTPHNGNYPAFFNCVANTTVPHCWVE